MSKICVFTRCVDPYEHDPKNISTDVWHGDLEADPISLARQLKHAHALMTHKDTGWYTIIVLDTLTGETKQLFKQVNDKRKRVEFNLKAKELNTKRVVIKPASLWGLAPPDVSFVEMPEPVPVHPEETGQ